MICDYVQFLINAVIVNNEVVDVEGVKLSAVIVRDGDIFRCTEIVCNA